MVVYLYAQKDAVVAGGPRMGLVVSKAVGNAVTRHAVSRRLRHIAGPAMEAAGLDTGQCVVLRALPASAGATSKELDADVRRALRRLTQ